VVSHRTDYANREIHKFWNPEETYEWVEATAELARRWRNARRVLSVFRKLDPQGWGAAVAMVVLIIAIATAPSHLHALDPSTWNTSDQETGFSCSLGGDTANQLTHEYASCVHVVYTDIESWH
jgi:hypothetical protein